MTLSQQHQTSSILQGQRHILDEVSAHYPSAFRDLEKPPQQLFLIGSLDALQEGLAVIGARKATPYGRECATKFAGIAAQKGIVIISGGALGCDSAAHKAALDAKGKTLVILGGGCDRLYPSENYELFQRVIDSGGAVMSEHSWKTPPLPYMFRTRNRLIAALSRATLIVEAGLPSGTFSTADEALANNREVLAIPGSIASPTSKGANRLIYQGATPIVDEDSFDDILFSLFGTLRQQSYIEASLDDEELLMALKAMPMHTEEMLELVNPATSKPYQISELLVALAEYQQKGSIQRYPDGSYGARCF